MATEAFDVFDAVGSLFTGAEVGTTDIDGIGTMADGFETTFEVAGGG